MKAGSIMYTTLQLMALGFCSVLTSASAVAQASKTKETSESHEQKSSSAHAVLAVVVRNNAPVYPNGSNGHAISVCPKGWYLTVMGETPHDYRVLAAHSRRVYVTKADVKLLGYTVPMRQPRH